MNLNREGCMKSTQKQQLGCWKQSQQLLNSGGQHNNNNNNNNNKLSEWVIAGPSGLIILFGTLIAGRNQFFD
jgi:hypothetical protein